MCGGVCGHVKACVGMCGCVRAGKGVRGSAHVCAGMFWEWGNPFSLYRHTCVLKCLNMFRGFVGVCECVRACAGMCGRVLGIW